MEKKKSRREKPPNGMSIERRKKLKKTKGGRPICTRTNNTNEKKRKVRKKEMGVSNFRPSQKTSSGWKVPETEWPRIQERLTLSEREAVSGAP